LGTVAKQQRFWEAFRAEVAEQVFIRTDARGRVWLATAPLVENEGERPPPPLLPKQVPAELIVVLLLRADVKDDVGDRQQAEENLAVRQVVAVQVRRIDQNLFPKIRSGVRHEAALLKGRVQPFGFERFVVIDNGVARR